MTAHSSRRLRPGRPRLGRLRRFVLAAFGVSIGMLSSGAGPANAVSEFRLQLPINAGTLVGLNTNYCTVGAVLSSTSAYTFLSPRAMATRYIVLAGHCGEVSHDITVGNSEAIGKVIWKSEIADTEIARIDPLPRNNYRCDGSSVMHRCMPITTYTPRAIGNVFLLDRVGRYASIPVTGSGVPDPREIFCTSGAVTGVNCSWGLTRRPSGSPPYILSATTYRNLTEGGDSGGPVVSRGGQLYGIISQAGHPHMDHPDTITFTPLFRVFEEQRGYQLAPPG